MVNFTLDKIWWTILAQIWDIERLRSWALLLLLLMMMKLAFYTATSKLVPRRGVSRYYGFNAKWSVSANSKVRMLSGHRAINDLPKILTNSGH